MGYRSDIKAVFYTKDTEQWPALRLFFDENFPKDFMEDLKVIGSEWCSGYMLSFEAVKWYDGYPDVKAYNKFVMEYTELIDGESELPWMYEFIRVGEDNDDVETVRAGDAQYVLDVRREITCDF